MEYQDLDIERIEQYSLEELQEYIKLSENRPIIKKHIQIKLWHIVCSVFDMFFALIGIFPLAAIFNADNLLGFAISFIALFSAFFAAEVTIHKVYSFINSRFEIEIIYAK